MIGQLVRQIAKQVHFTILLYLFQYSGSLNWTKHSCLKSFVIRTIWYRGKLSFSVCMRNIYSLQLVQLQAARAIIMFAIASTTDKSSVVDSIAEIIENSKWQFLGDHDSCCPLNVQFCFPWSFKVGISHPETHNKVPGDVGTCLEGVVLLRVS